MSTLESAKTPAWIASRTRPTGVEWIWHGRPMARQDYGRNLGASSVAGLTTGARTR
jgi:hypothetical protein